MSMKIITGSTGETHVTSNNDGELYQGIFGDGLVVLPNGNKLAATLVDNNTITIADGDLVLQGRHALIEPGTTETINISTGNVDMNRNDLIVARYSMDSDTGYESLGLVVIEGTPTSGSAADPAYTSGDIRTGASLVEVPLYRVKIQGVSITAIEPLFKAEGGSIIERFGGLSIYKCSSEAEYNSMPSHDANTIYVWPAE